MATTQLPLPGPHAFPPPLPPHLIHQSPQLPHPPNTQPFPAPLYRDVQYGYQRYPSLTELTDRQRVQLPPVIHSPPRKRQSAVPVESLLQSEPYSPSYTKPVISPKLSAYDSPRATLTPRYSNPAPCIESPTLRPGRADWSHFNRTYSFNDENRPNAPLPPSPYHRSHRDSAASRFSSRTSSSDYAAEPTSVPKKDASLAMAPPVPQKVLSRYKLTIRQQPIAARACGFGERDRRVIDPPPILQLSLTDFDPESAADVEELRWPLNVAHCALYSVPHQSSAVSTGIDVTSIPDPNNPSKFSRRLMGTLVATPFVGIDPEAPACETENSRLGCFFIFHDLSCRQNGLYKLRFTLMHLNVELALTGGQGSIVSNVESDVFEVFSAKDFPGMKASTALTRDLKRQGANVQVKKGNEGKASRKGQKRSGTESGGSPSDESDEDNAKAKPGRKRKKNQ